MKRLIALAILLAAGTSLGPAPAAYAQQQTLNLQAADIPVFIQDVARATGQTFLTDLKGRATVDANRNLEAAAGDPAVQLLLTSILESSRSMSKLGGINPSSRLRRPPITSPG